MPPSAINLKGFSYTALFRHEGLAQLDEAFLNYLKIQNAKLHEALLAYRNPATTFSPIALSEFLLQLAPLLENYLAELFQIEESVAIARIKTTANNPISIFKKYFVLRRAKKEGNRLEQFPSFEILTDWLQTALDVAPLKVNDPELEIALLGTTYLENPERHKDAIEKLVQWCARALFNSEGQAYVSNWKLFHIPEKINYSNLIPTIAAPADLNGRTALPPDQFRLRDGFALTDPRMNARQVQDEINYCIYCHDHDGDFCSKGFPTKKGDKSKGFKKNPLDLTLTGCPLEEKISEMNLLKRDGLTLAALAMVMVDNPMCPATGHRICNDCMKACVYQKQDPVNIPQIETRVLTDVLDLPWGVEIYDLLTRWNPLRRQQWIMKPFNGLKVMIAGMGPAGFTLAHHLLLEGFAVVGFDGLKIEPLPEALLKNPVYSFEDLKESLDERLMAGFGGVAEYGITVRWDKNFLKLIYLSLCRRPYFQVFGSVRFGGTIKVEDAWRFGFDHFVVAVGAGLSKALAIPHSLATGMRQANDFLMALQLGNAAKISSLTNLQIRLPAVVIGGGLTGVDAATELQAYYIVQVEKILLRYETLQATYGDSFIQHKLDSISHDILQEFLIHGRAVRAERQRAQQAKQRPNFIKLLHAWGGVTIVYRRTMQASPAYVHNHEELLKALQEGIYYLENMEPKAVDLDKHGHTCALICQKRIRLPDNTWITDSEEVRLDARTILAATGTQPNTAYEFEHKGTFNRLKLQYQHYEDRAGKLDLASAVEHCKEPDFGPFTSYQKHDKRVSLIGDTHPVFHGSVVKAIASGMRTYPKITQLFQDKIGVGNDAEYRQFQINMQQLFTARIISVTRKTKRTLEITIEAPIAAQHFQVGEFYRLQNYETFAQHVENTLLQMEPLALIATGCNKEQGLLTFIVQEHNATSKLCALLKPGEPVSLMGPTGVRAKKPSEDETILIIGNSSSFAFVRSFSELKHKSRIRVMYICYVDDPEELYCQKEIEDATDMVIWVTPKEEAIVLHRSQDFFIKENSISDVLNQFKDNQVSGRVPAISFAEVDRVFVVGHAELLREFQEARKTILIEKLPKQPKVFGSVYGNMQCMLKGVCAQCLQWQIDPTTGKRTKAVFACSWQDQPLEIIDIDHIDARQGQNRLHDELTNLWLEHLFEKYHLPRI